MPNCVEREIIREEIYTCSRFFFVIICGLMIVFAKDNLSRIFVIMQSVLMLMGYIFGVFRVSQYCEAFKNGRKLIIIRRKKYRLMIFG